MGKRGPKLTKIDWIEFEKLCSMHCTLIEISEFFNCSEDTIERAVKRHYKGEKFADIFKKKSSRGKISLRRKMFLMALDGDRVMCIWLSKQHLGMTDKVEEKVTSKSIEVVQVQWADEGKDASQNASSDAPPKKNL